MADEDERRAALLVAVCRRDAIDRLAPDDVGVLMKPAACERFLSQASGHSVLGLALATLERARLIELLPAETAAALRETLRGLRRRATILQFERDRVAGILARRDVPVVVLKGAGLASTVYAEIVEREFGDIDLLVPRDSLDAAVDALAANGYGRAGPERAEEGYREHHFHIRVQRSGGPLVELHWGLTAAREPYTLDPVRFLASAVRADAVVRVPRAELALLHIVTENARDAFSRLNRLVDIDRIVAAAPALDWTELIARAGESGLRLALGLSLALARETLGTTVPTNVRAALRPARGARVHLELLEPARALVEQRALTRGSWGELMRVWLLPSGARLPALARMLRADSDHPLQWLWDGSSPDTERRLGFLDRAGHVTRTVAFQFEVYARAAARVARRRPRRPELW